MAAVNANPGKTHFLSFTNGQFLHSSFLFRWSWGERGQWCQQCSICWKCSRTSVYRRTSIHQFAIYRRRCLWNGRVSVLCLKSMIWKKFVKVQWDIFICLCFASSHDNYASFFSTSCLCFNGKVIHINSHIVNIWILQVRIRQRNQD